MAGITPRAERSATAFGLAGLLEAYEAQLQSLSLREFDAGRYRLLARELREIGAAAMALPQLSADLMEIAMRHRGLARLLCRRPAGRELVPPEVSAALLQRQGELVRGVREKCMRLIPRVRCRRLRELRRRPAVQAPR